MPLVKLDQVIQAPIDEVWEILLDIESYPREMEHVRSVEIVEQFDGRQRRAAWSVLLKGSILEWLEEERIDSDNYAIEFRQLSGDLEHFDGHWALEASGERETTAVFEVLFEIGIPPLAEMLNPVAQRSLRENCAEMLRGIEQRSSLD
jgi:uncharacterized membrane protein